MKKALYALLLATLMVFMVPLSSYAGHSRVYGGVNITVGHPGWRGHYGGGGTGLTAHGDHVSIGGAQSW